MGLEIDQKRDHEGPPDEFFCEGFGGRLEVKHDVGFFSGRPAWSGLGLFLVPPVLSCLGIVFELTFYIVLRFFFEVF